MLYTFLVYNAASNYLDFSRVGTIPKDSDKIPKDHILKILRWFRDGKPLKKHISPNISKLSTHTKDQLKPGKN